MIQLKNLVSRPMPNPRLIISINNDHITENIIQLEGTNRLPTEIYTEAIVPGDKQLNPLRKRVFLICYCWQVLNFK